MIIMSDKELQAIRQRKIAELQKEKILNKQKTKSEIDITRILNKLFKGRAWEVLNISATQFPQETSKLRKLLVKLALEGKISQINGEQLFALIRKLGLPIKLNTSIKYLGKGKTTSISEKFKESMK
jgi:DNA-binding TFAR19-related protein (PDSD5 family)